MLRYHPIFQNRELEQNLCLKSPWTFLLLYSKALHHSNFAEHSDMPGTILGTGDKLINRVKCLPLEILASHLEERKNE